MAGQAEFESRIRRVSRRAARTPMGRTSAMRRRPGRHLHGTLGVPISALVGLMAGWGGMVVAHLWLRPWWAGAASVAEAPLAALAGLELGTIVLGLGPALAALAVILLGFWRFWHLAVAATCSVGAFYAAPFVVDFWPEIAEAPPPDWMVAAFTA